ncbi:hypothetical protein [Sorangium sp. So ce1153]|uniref:hypothetical protein n=1 Tax=Sorangium sp. So ce1153 TaxID=3133333 RepID=UPI003F5FB853
MRSTVSERESSLIRDARNALDAHDAVADLEARRLLEAHAREFPRGRLVANAKRCSGRFADAQAVRRQLGCGDLGDLFG